MLYHLFYPLHEAYSIFNVFRYITFRTIYAILTALLITLILGPYLIKKLQALNIKQYIREDGPSAHLNKSGTPTMGGILILLSLTIATLFWGDLTNTYIWIALLTTWGLGIIGIIDDLKKLRSKSSDGVSPRFKLCGQILLGAALGTFLYLSPDFDKNLTIPFFKAISINLGIFYILFVIVLIRAGFDCYNYISSVFLFFRSHKDSQLSSDSLHSRQWRINHFLWCPFWSCHRISLVQYLSSTGLYGRRGISCTGWCFRDSSYHH